MRARPAAIVTGGGAGIGAATCRALAKAGYDVCIGFRSNAAGAASTEAECRALGGDAFAFGIDVAEDEACRTLALRVGERWGRIDALVNNAGTTVLAAHADLKSLSADDFAALNAVNVVGPFQLSRAAAVHLRAARGAIVNVSSLTGLNGRGSSIAYATSKAALNMLTVTLARALAPVRVNAIAPGMVETDWMRRAAGEEAHQRAKAGAEARAALGRIATAEEVADAIVWLLHAPAMTGEILRLDSGLSLGR